MPSRLIYKNGQRIGPPPIGFHVYLWLHFHVKRYYGHSGGPTRWLDHMTDRRYAHNVPWYQYINEHMAELSCIIVMEGMASKDHAARLETVLIDEGWHRLALQQPARLALSESYAV